MGKSIYGQYCPVALAAEILTERWTPLVLRELLEGIHRFNELRRGVPLMSPTLLSSRLQRLERSGVVSRTRPPGSRHWEYHLTEAGEDCRPLINLMATWGQRWALEGLPREEFDPSLVMWFVFRRVRAQASQLPAERAVIQFQFLSAAKGKRYWWLVLSNPQVDLCLSDPGFGVDLTWQSEARELALILLGGVTIERAVRSRTVALAGPPQLRRSIPQWLGLEADQSR